MFSELVGQQIAERVQEGGVVRVLGHEALEHVDGFAILALVLVDER